MNLNLADYEEIMNLQQQGRRLSNMQMQSLNDFVQRRLSMSNNNILGAQQQMQQQQQPKRQMPLSSTSSLQYPMWYSRGNGMPFDINPQQMMQQQHQHSSSSASTFGAGTNEQSYGQSFTPELFRRDSLGLVHNVLDEFGYSPDGFDRRTSMEKRNSLDLLGDAAVALSSNTDASNTNFPSLLSSSMDPSSNATNNSSMNRNYMAPPNSTLQQNARRSSLDFLLGGGGDAMFGRRNSLTQFLIQEFANPSRRSSILSTVPINNKPMDPFYLENLLDDPSIYSSNIAAKNYHSSSSSDLFGMQLLQQPSQQDTTNMVNHNNNHNNNHNHNHRYNMDNNSAGDYLFLQNLQDSLKRQSWSNALTDFSMVQQQQQHHHHHQQQQHLQTNQTHGNTTHLQKSKKKDIRDRPKHIIKETEIQVDPNDLPPFTLERMYSFKSSMDKSTQSQTDIQMWDKKMGLKRSHSATMTQTTRSRKKLRKILEIHLDILTKTKMETHANTKRQKKDGQ